MKKYLLILAAILLLWSCIAEDRTECTNPRGVFVSLTVRPERMSSVTRSADETAIRDLNLYLYDDNGNVVLHRYQTSATLRFECLPGDYRMCIAANLGRDLGDNLTVTHADKYDVLPMAYEGDITIIPSADGMLTLLAVEVQRCVSKISYNITVTPAVADIELRSVQLFSVPRSVSVFDMAAAPSDDPDDYTDCPEVGLSGQQAAGDCYLLPNMQGVVATITDQRQKNPENAPANASYLLIRAVRGSKILAYYIYLGGNNTSDFNVRANMHSRLNISILGDSEVDTRISSYAVNVHDTYEENSVGGYCTYNPFQMLAVEIDGSPAPLTLRGRIGVAQGNAGAFCLNGSPVGEGRDLTLPEQPGPNVFGVNYAPGIYTTVNSQVVYTVTVEDDAGFTQSFDIGHRFANRLDVYIHPATAENGNGTVTVAGALYDAETSSLTHDRVVLCHEKGCTLTAVPEAGYRFEGWYSAADYKTRLSTSASYAYIPTSPEAAIFPKFTANTRPLDDEGTANCYIAPELNTSYSFDATTMGNGRATTNIVPKRLAEAEAKVLWETGTIRGAIVESAEFAERQRALMTIGIRPDRPATGYGYIQVDNQVRLEQKDVYKVKTFTEKPNLELARSFVESGEFFWNSGIFIWKVDAIMENFERLLPDMHQMFASIAPSYGTPQEQQSIERIYPECRNISIDFGIMEKAGDVYVRCSDFGWSDVGTWGSLYQHSAKDADGNVAPAENMLYDTKGCIVKVPAGKLVVIEGLEDYIVVDSGDVLMICPKSGEQNIKKFIDEVKFHNGDKHI